MSGMSESSAGTQTFFGFGASTNAGFTHKDEEKFAKFKLYYDKTSIGDVGLLESEYNREATSKINWIYIIIVPLLMLMVGLCSVAMFSFKSEFARYVFIMVILAVFWELFLFRNVIILVMTLVKWCLAWKRGYFRNSGLYSKSEKKIGLKVREIMMTSKEKRKDADKKRKKEGLPPIPEAEGDNQESIALKARYG